MSAAKIDKLVRMANQIGDFFGPMEEEAATIRRRGPSQTLLDTEND